MSAPRTDIDWMRLLRDAIAHHRTVAAVAVRLGFSRGYVSQVINGLKRPPASFVTRVIDRLHVVPECPATREPQPRSECMRIALDAPPIHNPYRMQIWKACQSCPHKPVKKKEEIQP